MINLLPKTSFSRLKLLLLALLLIPLSFLSIYMNRYFTFEAFQETKRQAQAITYFTNDRLRELIRSEDLRPFTEYSLNNVKEIGLSYFVSVSPLANIEPSTNFPGVIGYFQIESSGSFTSPIWPARKLSEERELNQVPKRKQKLLELYDLIKNAELLGPTKTAKKDNLKLTKYKKNLQLRGERGLRDPQIKPVPVKKSKSLKKVALKSKAEMKGFSKASPKKLSRFSIEQARKQIRIKGLDATVDPFLATVLETGNIVFHREVRVGKRRYLQGFVVDERQFFSSILNPKYRRGLSEDKQDQIVIASGDQILPSFTQAEKFKNQQILVLKSGLPAPLESLNLFYSTPEIRFSASWSLINAILLIIFLILSVGLSWLYILNQKQTELLQKQSNFVSAVSHELRTPLTAIRMHSEMLQSDWVGSEDKKQKAYGFILNESERLSRLINNILSMARIGKDQLDLKLEAYSVKDLVQVLQNRVQPIATGAGFELLINTKENAETAILHVDKDAFVQIFLNLVDNSVKFAKDHPPQKIEIDVSSSHETTTFSVRDYGPGVPTSSKTRIFELFYRGESELTRSTTGTGIGLALVQQLTKKMGGNIDYKAANPGSCFEISFLISK